MPRRAAPGDRAAIEAVLARTPLPEATLLDALELLREISNIRDWRLSPLADAFTHTAIVLRAAELVQGGMAVKDAADSASRELGVSPETTRSRGRRWPRDSRGATCTPRARSDSGNVKKPGPERRQ